MCFYKILLGEVDNLVYIAKISIMLIFSLAMLVACSELNESNIVILPNGSIINFDLQEQSVPSEYVLKLKMGTSREILLGSELKDIKFEYDGDAVTVQKSNGKITITANTVGTSRIVFSNSEIKFVVMAVVQSPPSQIAGSLDVDFNKTNEYMGFEADGSYLQLSTSLGQGAGGYSLEVDADNNLEVSVVGESAYVASVYTGEYDIVLKAVKDNAVIKETTVKVNFVEPTLNMDYVIPNLDDVRVGVGKFKISAFPSNLNLNRVQVAVGAGVKDTEKSVEYKLESSENLDIKMLEHGVFELTPIGTGDASFTITSKVKGYQPHICVRSFTVLPPLANLSVTQKDIILDTLQTDVLHYTLGDAANLDISYDKDSIELTRATDRLYLKGKKLGTGQILLKAVEAGKDDNKVTIDYTVSEKKLRMSLKEENLPDTLTNERYFSLSGLPSTAKVEVSVSDEKLVNLSVESSRFLLKPLDDGVFRLDIKATDTTYAPLYISKEIKVDMPKLTLEVDSSIVDVNENATNKVVIKRVNGGTITVKSSDENIAKAKISGTTIIVEGKAEGKTKLIVTAERQGYKSAELQLDVNVGKRQSRLTVPNFAESYKDFISTIVATVDTGADVQVSSEGGVEILDKTTSFDKVRIKYRASSDGAIVVSAKSGDYLENTARIPVAFKTKSTRADGIDILYMFEQNAGHSVYKHNTIMSELFSEEPTVMDTVPTTSGEQLIELTMVVNDIVKGQTTATGKAKAIYNWIVRNIYYDYDGLEGRRVLDNSAYGTYKNRRGICTGYSALYSDMLRIAGVPSRIIEGQYAYPNSNNWDRDTINSHAWNEAWIDGKWVSIDTTWGTYYKFKNGYYDSSAGIDTSMKYFAVSLQKFSNDHRIDRIVQFYS